MTVLTNTRASSLTPGETVPDGRVAGLMLACRPSGKKCWMLQYRTKRRVQRRMKLGEYPALSIADAREYAGDVLLEVSRGKDPCVERRETDSSITVDQLWALCEAKHWNDPAKTWHKEAKRLYEKFIAPKLKKKRVALLAFPDVDAVYTSLKETPTQANRVLAVLAKMLRLAEKWQYRPLNSNPCSLVDKKFAEEKRGRYASVEELGKIGAVLARYDNQPEYTADLAFIYLMAFTGARPTEIGRATPDMLMSMTADNERHGVLTIAEGKTGKRTVFIPPQAMRVLDRLPADRKSLAGRSTVPDNFWNMVRTEAGCPDLWLRDLRRTFATVGLSNDVSSSRIGELLGHRSAQTTKIYAKLMPGHGAQTSAEIAGRVEKMMRGTG